MVKLKLEPSYDTVHEAISALHRELARLSKIEFNPRKVPGSLLIEFDAYWDQYLRGWVWSDDTPGWTTDNGFHEEGVDAVLLVPDGFYDIRGLMVYYEKDMKFDKAVPLVSLIRKWLDDTRSAQ